MAKSIDANAKQVQCKCITKAFKNMRYLVLTTDPLTGEKSAFKTNWFEAENHYNPDYQMIVVDLSKDLVTFDGEVWGDIDEDHL